MKRLKISSILFVLIVFLSFPAMGAQKRIFEGSMQGYSCVLHGHTCPRDALDPHLELEPDFVLYKDSDEYYLLPNVSKVVKAKYVHKPIRIVGTMSPRYRAIDVDELQVMKDDTFKTVWSKEMVLRELKARQELMYSEGGG
ncbi:MAG: hypothetical protein QNJ17_09505 [Desulfocapsaceae bacterium]|nr:hypothetical protein [Desulfocapsaceae bacterium]